MDMQDQLLDRIYQAGVQPSLWSAVLEEIAIHFGAIGANLITQTIEGPKLVSTPAVAQASAEFTAGGWQAVNTRVSRLLERYPYPGFLADSHVHNARELRELPMYAEFLNPRGVAAGAATIVQGTKDDGLIVAFEGFPDHPASRRATRELDRLRPHLARAMALSSQIEAMRAKTALDVFDACGGALALLDGHGGLWGRTRASATRPKG